MVIRSRIVMCFLAAEARTKYSGRYVLTESSQLPMKPLSMAMLTSAWSMLLEAEWMLLLWFRALPW